MDLKTILSKPLPVVWFRFKQLAWLVYYKKTNHWTKTKQSVKTVSDQSIVYKQKSLLFADNSVEETTNTYFEVDHADQILSGKISIFNVNYSFKFPLKWNEDWRHNHQWKNTFYKNYSFYEKEKQIPYDVKFPWELSRLSFLIPVARAYKQTKSTRYLDFIYNILEDWNRKNPIAHSVNWYAMEVSVRSINLIQVREILLLSKNTDKTICLLNEILILHGVFLWRNIEYTDVRGNHYSANLTALLLLGNTYKQYYPEAKKWLRYAINNLEKEFHLQFIKDGVNFEKSTQYHRFVVELYLISFIVLQRIKKPVKTQTFQVLKEACYFIKDISKPDHTTPVIGDNDSASVFQIASLSLLNHSPILQLASVFLKEKEINSTATLYPFTKEIFGDIRLESIKKEKTFESFFYNEGGYFIAKDASNYFITDVGEVGMNGRGGHGHNDLFSFELFLNNNNLIVDAGCYTYTGDLEIKSKMKSTDYHNVLSVDNQEIAPLIGEWGISDIAKPYNVLISDKEQQILISGRHKAYHILSDPTTHTREFSIDKNNFKFICKDRIQCESTHLITRYLHFAEGVTFVINNNEVNVKQGKHKYLIRFDKESTLESQNYLLSEHYGKKVTAQKLIIKTNILQSTTLTCSVEK